MSTQGGSEREQLEAAVAREKTAWAKYYAEKRRADRLEAVLWRLGEMCGARLTDGIEEVVGRVNRVIVAATVPVVRLPRLPRWWEIDRGDSTVNLAGVASARRALRRGRIHEVRS